MSCSLRKGARVLGGDPATGEETRIFHPRSDEWGAHFETGATSEIIGRTAVGRATIELLQLNRPVAVAIRSEERLRSRWP